jgi:hypothetical protein
MLQSVVAASIYCWGSSRVIMTVDSGQSIDWSISHLRVFIFLPNMTYKWGTSRVTVMVDGSLQSIGSILSMSYGDFWIRGDEIERSDASKLPLLCSFVLLVRASLLRLLLRSNLHFALRLGFGGNGKHRLGGEPEGKIPLGWPKMSIWY